MSKSGHYPAALQPARKGEHALCLGYNSDVPQTCFTGNPLVGTPACRPHSFRGSSWWSSSTSKCSTVARGLLCVLCGPATESSRSLLEMQILRPHPRPTESENLEVRPGNPDFNKPLGTVNFENCLPSHLFSG